MGVKFKCRLTGNVFEFVNDYDIEDMRDHPQYDEVKELPSGVQTKEKQDTKKEVKKTTKTVKAEE